MKKTILSLVAFSLLANPVFAQQASLFGPKAPAPAPVVYDNCKDQFMAETKANKKDEAGSLLMIGWAGGFGLLTYGWGWIPFVPPGLFFEGRSIYRTIKSTHMVKLINESETFVTETNAGGAPKAGRFLRRLHRAAVRANANASMYDVAMTVVKANADKSMCTKPRMDMRDVKRAIKSGEIQVVQ